MTQIHAEEVHGSFHLPISLFPHLLSFFHLRLSFFVL